MATQISVYQLSLEINGFILISVYFSVFMCICWVIEAFSSAENAHPTKQNLTILSFPLLDT